MQLEYTPSTKSFWLRVPRKETQTIRTLMRDHGMDMSMSAGNSYEAVLFTKEPYCAVTFMDDATDEAKAQLAGIADRIASSRKLTSDGHFKVPADQELWGFQKADLEYMLQRSHTLVGDQPGLGKTPIAIAFANEISAKRVLVICPASIRLQWIKRIREWTTMRWPYSIHLIQTARNGVHPTANWTVTSYEMVRNEAINRALLKGTYDLIIMDEAHYIKTPTSLRTMAIFRAPNGISQALAERAGAILALTGTPLPNRPREAYTLCKGLCWDAIDWMSEKAFGERFNPIVQGEKEDGSWYKREDTGRHAELQNRLRANFMTRHLKIEAMPQLKLPLYDIVQLQETGPVKQALAAEKLLDIDPDTFEGADAAILGEVATVRRMMGIAIAPQVAQYIDMLIDGGEEKLVVFAWHTEVLDILEAAWLKYGVVRVDGKTSPKQKEERVQQFRTDPRCQIIIGNTLSLGTGTDGLQDVAWHALHAEPDWVPGNNEQCFDRLNRGGQKLKVQGDLFAVPGSILERILASALRKLKVTNKTLDHRGL